MNTSGHGNDSMMVLLVIGIALGIGMIVFGGPGSTLEAVDTFLRQTTYEALKFANTLMR